MTAEAYARLLKSLLPPGRAWNLHPDSNLSKLLLACADELERLHGRTDDLQREMDPRQADELLPDYERVLGITAASGDSLELRRGRVVAALVQRLGFRPADFRRALADLLGQDEADVVVIERSRADAVAMENDRAIFRFYIYRNPALAGSYDVDAAQAQVDRMKPAHTRGRVIESVRFKCGDPHSICGRDLLAPDPVV